jgi:hypothetical protein
MAEPNQRAERKGTPWIKWGLGALAIVAVVAASWINRDVVLAVFTRDQHTVDYGSGKVHLVQADRRAIFVFPERDKAGFACAEPSPDVSAAVERAVKAITEAQGKLPKQGEVKVTQDTQATQKIVMDSLMERTQGLQVLRDMLFQACLANVRGDMSGLQYVTFVSSTLPKLTTSYCSRAGHEERGGKGQLSGPDLQVFLRS